MEQKLLKLQKDIVHLSPVLHSLQTVADLGLIASCSNTSGVLLHSLRRARLVRKLDVENVHEICHSPKGVVLIWNELEKKICNFTVNGIPIATKTLSPFSGTVNCIQISIDGENALLGTCSNRDDDSTEYKATDLSNHSTEELGSSSSNKDAENRTVVPVPSILFLNLHTLEVFYSLALGDGQDVTAIALNNDNTKLLVSTPDKQFIVFTDPDWSRKLADQISEQQGDVLIPRRR